MNRIKRFILPVAIILIGAGAAFATNVAKESDSDLVDGYYYDTSSENCVKAENATCTTTPGAYCTWTDKSSNITHTLYLREESNTSCIKPLYQP